MKKLSMALLALALISTVSMAEDCVAPSAPDINEGEESTMEQMLETQKAVKAYQAANLEYMSCLELELAAAEAAAREGAEGAVEQYTTLQEIYNAAVSAEEEVAGKFNNEIREYKAANPG